MGQSYLTQRDIGNRRGYAKRRPYSFEVSCTSFEDETYLRMKGGCNDPPLISFANYSNYFKDKLQQLGRHVSNRYFFCKFMQLLN